MSIKGKRSLPTVNNFRECHLCMILAISCTRPGICTSRHAFDITRRLSLSLVSKYVVSRPLPSHWQRLTGDIWMDVWQHQFNKDTNLFGMALNGTEGHSKAETAIELTHVCYLHRTRTRVLTPFEQSETGGQVPFRRVVVL